LIGDVHGAIERLRAALDVLMRQVGDCEDRRDGVGTQKARVVALPFPRREGGQRGFEDAGSSRRPRDQAALQEEFVG